MSEKLDALEASRDLLDQFASSLSQVLESMAEQRPGAQWKAASGAIDAVTAGQEEMLWWEQPLQISAEMKIWVGAPKAAWQQIGELTLKAAGLDTVEIDEAKNTWLEILGQALSPVARSVGGILGREVTCDGGAERVPEEPITEWAEFSLSFKEFTLSPLLVTFSSALLESISAPDPKSDTTNALEAVRPGEELDQPLPRSRTMSLLLDVDLPVSISFGKTQLPMKDVIKLTTGSIVELNRGVNEMVDVLVNQCLIARGEVVVIEGNYGVRILEIATRHERMKTLR